MPNKKISLPRKICKTKDTTIQDLDLQNDKILLTRFKFAKQKDINTRENLKNKQILLPMIGLA